MIASRHRVFLWTGLLVIVNWLLIAFLDPDPGRSLLETVALGFFFGSMFAHTTLAAVWAAFGPAPLIWRVPFSLIWVTMLAVAVAINIGINGGPREGALLLGACFLCQWLILQFPLWGLVLGLGLRLRHLDEDQLGSDRRESQFGIRQLIIVTAIVGVCFGIGRMALMSVGKGISFGQSEMAIFAFLVVAAILLSLPLLLAGLVRGRAMPGVLLTLLLIGLATASEVPLLQSFHTGSGPKVRDFVAINAITSAVILAFATVVRFNGYSLATRQVGSSTKP